MSTFDRVRWPRRTERLLIRPFVQDDADAVWDYRRLDEVATWMSTSWPSYEDFREKFRDPERVGKTLVIEVDGQVVGDLMLHVEDAWSQTEVLEQGKGVQAEIGWCIHPAYAGKGLATEAVRELLRVAFEELGLHRVTANCFADNEPSWRLMERVGMRREVHGVRDSLHRSGQWLDGFGYALLADEWRG